jgi:hypothetical protein
MEGREEFNTKPQEPHNKSNPKDISGQLGVAAKSLAKKRVS